MTIIDASIAIEAERLKLQRILDAQKTQLERNKSGQFATPSALAIDMLAYAKSILSDTQEITFLDPAIGTGAFFSALLRSFPASQIKKSVGYEIDPLYKSKIRMLWRHHDLCLYADDFTRVQPPETDDTKFNLLICNPPYVRHHYLSKPEKQRLQRVGAQATDIKLSEQAGLYCHFLFIAHKWMAQNGLAGWLIPGEFMSVNYGQQVREYLLNKVTLKRIHRFDAENSLFDDALVSSCIVWFLNTPPEAYHEVEFSNGGTLTQPETTCFVSIEKLRQTAKWTKFPLATHISIKSQEQPLLSDFFDIKRGLATGANKFFILDEQRISRYSIPDQFLTPILPNPRYLEVDEVRADERGLPLLKQKLFLLDCDISEAEIRADYPGLWEYLQEGMKIRTHQGYICSHRNPWYVQEHRPAPLFLCAYMGRQTGRRGKPFRFVLNHSSATATNAYHMLYPKLHMQTLLDADPQLAHRIWQALNAISLDMLINEGRVYGGGLYKMEPRELGNVPCPSTSFGCSS